MSALSPLVGRAEELEVMSAALDEAAGGTARTVVVEGEAGIGKTRLIDELAAAADERGFPVLSDAADEIDRARPFGPLLRALERADGAPSGLDELTSEYAQREAIVAAIEAIVGRSPTVLVLDDLQWADAATIATVPLMAQRLDGLPLLLVLSSRPVPRPAELDVALGRFDAARITLGPLADAEATLLLGERSDAEELVRRAGGNPFFILELAEAGDAAGSNVFQRLSYLDPDTVELVRIASVLGSTFTLADLAIVDGRPAAQLLPALTEAIQAGVIGERGAELIFRHDLLREAAYESVPVSARAALHRDAANALAAAGAPAIRVATQFATLAEPGDVNAVDWLRRAAANAPHAPAVAIPALQRALELATGPNVPVELAHELAVALESAGRLSESEAVCRDALRAGNSAGTAAARVWVRLIHALVFQGRGADVLAEAENARAHVQQPREIALLDAYAAMGRVFVGDMAGASAAAEEVVGRDPSVADAAACWAEVTLSVSLRLQGRVGAALRHADRAVEIASGPGGDAAARFDPEHFRAMCLQDLPNLDACAQSIANGRRNAERLGLAWNLPGYHYLEGRRLYLLGQWDDALTELDTGLLLDADIGSPDLPSALASKAQLLVGRDDLEGAALALQAADEARARAGSSMGFDRSAAAQATLNMVRAQAEPFAGLDSVWSLMQAIGVVSERPDFAADLVRDALARGDTDRAGDIAAEATALATDAGSAFYDAAAAHCRGLVEGSAAQLVAVAAAYRELSFALHEARAAEDAARLLGKENVAAAREHLEAALAFYERAGAVNDVARATAALRGLGVRRGSRARHARATSGWEALTPTELSVVRLVTEGLTTAEIAARLYISTHTVTTHVKHVFAKLNMSSRVELAAAASRRLPSMEPAG